MPPKTHCVDGPQDGLGTGPACPCWWRHIRRCSRRLLSSVSPASNICPSRAWQNKYALPLLTSPSACAVHTPSMLRQQDPTANKSISASSTLGSFSFCSRENAVINSLSAGGFISTASQSSFANTDRLVQALLVIVICFGVLPPWIHLPVYIGMKFENVVCAGPNGLDQTMGSCLVSSVWVSSQTVASLLYARMLQHLLCSAPRESSRQQAKASPRNSAAPTRRTRAPVFNPARIARQCTLGRSPHRLLQSRLDCLERLRAKIILNGF